LATDTSRLRANRERKATQKHRPASSRDVETSVYQYLRELHNRHVFYAIWPADQIT